MFNQLSLTQPRFSNHTEFVAALKGLTDDPLAQFGGNIVVYRGNPQADIMIIGEGPGAKEDELRTPFVGRSGQLLNKIIEAVDFNVDTDVYFSNVVRRRPPNNRDPLPNEIDFFSPYLFEEIRLVNPKIILLIGRYAMLTILGEKRGITKVRGQWFQRGEYWIMPMFHHAYLLRNPSKNPGSPKALTWADIKNVRAKYDELISA